MPKTRPPGWDQWRFDITQPLPQSVEPLKKSWLPSAKGLKTLVQSALMRCSNDSSLEI